MKHDNYNAVRESFAQQARYCLALGSPFTAEICATLGECLDERTAVGARVLGWQGEPGAHGDSVPLRLAGALHALSRRGVPALTEIYPPHALSDRETLWYAIQFVLRSEESTILDWLKFPPQTNEVARSAILMPGLLVVAAETNFPLSLYEVGASGGLNLNLDQYSYSLGGRECGPSESKVRLAPEWRGAAPPAVDMEIVARRGSDIMPLDVTKPYERERLISYIWPDQAARLRRMQAALAIAAAHPPRMDQADAADWVEKSILLSENGVARVLMHSFAFQFFPRSSQVRITQRMTELGAQATEKSPLAWLSFEINDQATATLTLKLWPSGAERTLASADAHGRWIEWRGA